MYTLLTIVIPIVFWLFARTIHDCLRRDRVCAHLRRLCVPNSPECMVAGDWRAVVADDGRVVEKGGPLQQTSIAGMTIRGEHVLERLVGRSMNGTGIVAIPAFPDTHVACGVRLVDTPHIIVFGCRVD